MHYFQNYKILEKRINSDETLFDFYCEVYDWFIQKFPLQDENLLINSFNRYFELKYRIK